MQFTAAAQAAVAEEVFSGAKKDSGLTMISVTPFEGKTELHASPLKRGMMLNFYGTVARIRTAHSFPLCEVFGQQFVLDGSAYCSLNGDEVMPAWLVTTVDNAEDLTLPMRCHCVCRDYYPVTPKVLIMKNNIKSEFRNAELSVAEDTTMEVKKRTIKMKFNCRTFVLSGTKSIDVDLSIYFVQSRPDFCEKNVMLKRLVVDVEGGSQKLKGIKNTKFGKAMLPARGNQLQACQAGPEDRCGKCM